MYVVRGPGQVSLLLSVCDYYYMRAYDYPILCLSVSLCLSYTVMLSHSDSLCEFFVSLFL